MIGTAEVATLVEAFHPGGDGEAEKSRELIRMLLEYSLAPFSRDSFTPGHITCTAAVVHPDGARILIIHHNRLDRWLLPGGHVEPHDARIWDAASREALEETGVAVIPQSVPPLAGLDVHAIPPRRKEPLHLHHDLIFAFRAASGDCQASPEARQVVWCPVEEFDRYQLPASIRRAASRARNHGSSYPGK